MGVQREKDMLQYHPNVVTFKTVSKDGGDSRFAKLPYFFGDLLVDRLSIFFA
jgi:hypothetical protein